MPSRISSACIACRSKKQKCSGDHPECLQCLDAGQACTWPEQKKRGPSKGYIEALENRLHETEQLLLQLLPVVSDEQLAAANDGLVKLEIDNNEMAGTSLQAFQPAAPPLLNNNTSVEYWDSYPLDSFHNARRWQQSCMYEASQARQITASRQRSPTHRHSSARGTDSRHGSPRGSTSSSRQASFMHHRTSMPAPSPQYVSETVNNSRVMMDPFATLMHAATNASLFPETTTAGFSRTAAMTQGQTAVSSPWSAADVMMFGTQRQQTQYTPPPEGFFFSTEDQKQFFW